MLEIAKNKLAWESNSGPLKHIATRVRNDYENKYMDKVFMLSICKIYYMMSIFHKITDQIYSRSTKKISNMENVIRSSK